MKSNQIYNETTLNKIEEFREQLRNGHGTPGTRRQAATYQRLAGCGVKPGTIIRTTYKKDRKQIEVLEGSKK